VTSSFLINWSSLITSSNKGAGSAKHYDLIVIDKQPAHGKRRCTEIYKRSVSLTIRDSNIEKGFVKIPNVSDCTLIPGIVFPG
jgi:hypothetical protein